MGLVLRNLPVIFRHSRLPVGHVDAGINPAGAVLRVGGNDLETVAIDPPRERVPKRVLDHSGKSVDGVLREAGLVEDDALAVVVAGEGKLLQQVRQHVRAADVEGLEPVTRRGPQRHHLGTGVRDADLEIPVRIFLLENDANRLFDVYEETARRSHSLLVVRHPPFSRMRVFLKGGSFPGVVPVKMRLQEP